MTPLASPSFVWRLHGRNNMVGKKKIFPGRVGKNPGEVGKKEIFFPGTIDVGTVVPRVQSN